MGTGAGQDGCRATTEGGVVRKRGLFAVLALVVAALVLAAAGCGGGDSGEDGGGEATQPADTGVAGGGEETTEGGGEATGSVTALPSSSCGPIEYGGEGEPNLLVASDMPLQGASRTQTGQINDAIRLVLDQAGWKAGDFNIAFQACDDATAQAGKWDSGKCSQNGQAYAGNESVIAIIGTFNSGCAEIIIPLLNQAPGGAIPQISPANTDVCLTESTEACQTLGKPDKFYPSGTRNYARVVANDAYQGAMGAQLAQELAVTKVFILNDKETYGLGVATNFQGAAKSLGIEVVGFEAWDPKAASYEALFQKVKESGANGVFFGGLIDENGGQLIRDKVAVLGPNAATGDEGVVLIAPDGFTTAAVVDPGEGGATEAEGMYLTVAGVPVDEFGPAGQEFITAFAEAYGDDLGGAQPDPYAAYGGQAAQVVLEAITAGGDDRAAVLEAMYAYTVEDGILGSFGFDENGDPNPAEGAVVSLTAYRASADDAYAEVASVISPPVELVEAARAG